MSASSLTPTAPDMSDLLPLFEAVYRRDDAAVMHLLYDLLHRVITQYPHKPTTITDHAQRDVGLLEVLSCEFDNAYQQWLDQRQGLAHLPLDTANQTLLARCSEPARWDRLMLAILTYLNPEAPASAHQATLLDTLSTLWSRILGCMKRSDRS